MTKNMMNRPATSAKPPEKNPVETGFDLTNSPAMQEVLRTIERIAASDLSVIITGEHGTGKEWAAHAIHRLSGRSRGSFYPVDCAAMPSEMLEKELFGYESIPRGGVEIRRGAFEESAGGTLLLNEIASLSPALQMRVARVVEYHQVRRIGGEEDIPVDARVVATLSQQSDMLMSKGVLRKEMYYRISPIVLELPPLRDRRADIPLLVEKFIGELRERHGSEITGIAQEALTLCLAYDWPGNVRQLKNAIEYSSIMSDGPTIRPEHLPPYLY
jgi:DNA-binding NtrC family response regulator